MLVALTQSVSFAVYHDASSSLFLLALLQTVSAIYSFFIAMQLYPEVQSKAQAEIDAVVGPDRMPMISDRPHLPYIDAMVKEVLRWNTVVPLCKLDSFTRSFQSDLVNPQVFPMSRKRTVCMRDIPFQRGQ